MTQGEHSWISFQASGHPLTYKPWTPTHPSQHLRTHVFLSPVPALPLSSYVTLGKSLNLDFFPQFLHLWMIPFYRVISKCLGQSRHTGSAPIMVVILIRLFSTCHLYYPIESSRQAWE